MVKMEDRKKHIMKFEIEVEFTRERLNNRLYPLTELERYFKMDLKDIDSEGFNYKYKVKKIKKITKSGNEE